MKTFRKIPIDEINKYYEIHKEGYITRRSNGEKVDGHINHYGYVQIYIKELKDSFLLHRIILCNFCTK